MKSFATFYPQCGTAPAVPEVSFDTCTIHMTVDTASITALRQLAMRVCGEAFEFMRIALCAGGTRIQVWLCVRLPCAALLSDTIARQMPGAEFKVHRVRTGELT